MDNYTIADQISLLAKLMDIHGENSFRAKSYSTAAYAIEKLPEELSGMPANKIYTIKGIGQSVGDKVVELLETGAITSLNELLERTPQGVLEMMNIKGLGPKKIHTLWKELAIDNIEDLTEACRQNRLSEKKGFGLKTEEKILEAINFKKQNAGWFLYIQVEPFVEAISLKLQDKFKNAKTEVTGDFRRQMEVVNCVEWVTTIEKEKLIKFFDDEDFSLTEESDQLVVFSASDMLSLRFHLAHPDNFHRLLFTSTGSPDFLMALQNNHGIKEDHYTSEEDIFAAHGLAFIPPFMRETASVIERARNHQLPKVIETADIKGLIHAHSSWSDGAHSLEDMIVELKRLGFEYLVISDHSKAAYYANGLSVERIMQQHKLIDELNQQHAPFKVFKSIECDILSDGTLDYPDSVLATFDLVIASIHSNQDMNQEKAMMRVMGAINNPYVTILGHMTGRLLNRRSGYPLDHKAIIDTCVKNNVVIEINASPNRLDMDWRWIEYALQQDLMLSIDPDAHSFAEFHNIKYGVLVAQKGGLTPAHNLSSMDLRSFEDFITKRKKAIKG